MVKSFFFTIDKEERLPNEMTITGHVRSLLDLSKELGSLLLISITSQLGKNLSPTLTSKKAFSSKVQVHLFLATDVLHD